MREITEIIVHCTETRANSKLHAHDIDVWHRRRGWDGCGYHFVINVDGLIELGRDIRTAGAHCYGHNPNSIGICYIGGLDAGNHQADTRTHAQDLAFRELLAVLHRMFPKASLHAHNEFSPKSCPNFDVHTAYDYIFKT